MPKKRSLFLAFQRDLTFLDTPLKLFGYKMLIAISALSASLAIYLLLV